MKKILLIMTCILLVGGCKNNKLNKQENKDNDNSTLICTRNKVEGGSEISENITITYKGSKATRMVLDQKMIFSLDLPDFSLNTMKESLQKSYEQQFGESAKITIEYSDKTLTAIIDADLTKLEESNTQTPYIGNHKDDKQAVIKDFTKEGYTCN